QSRSRLRRPKKRRQTREPANASLGGTCLRYRIKNPTDLKEEGLPSPHLNSDGCPSDRSFVHAKWQLTCGFFALNTGNVFSESARHPRSDRIIPRGNSDAARDGRISAEQKISEMLCLAGDQREGAILSRGLNSRAEQKRLSTAQALRHCAERQLPVPF